jgi:hypothetical protein
LVGLKESTIIASTTNHHNIADIDTQLQRFWELEEMFPTTNWLTAVEAACEQHFIDSTHRAVNGRYTVNQLMKQTKDQPLAIVPLQLRTNQKPNTKSAVIEKRDTSVSTIVAIIENTTFFKQYSALTRLQRTVAYCLRLFHNAKNFVASTKNSCSTYMTMKNFIITSPPMASVGISYHQHQTLDKCGKL